MKFVESTTQSKCQTCRSHSRRSYSLVCFRRNLDTERAKARLRARRYYNLSHMCTLDLITVFISARQLPRSTDDEERRKELHREAQARYREANRLRLKIQSWEYR
jgi:hypothetical protein